MAKKKSSVESGAVGPEALAEQLVKRLRELGWTVTMAESCTGGLIAAAVTSVAGSSEVFRQGYVTYCDEAKHSLLGVDRKTLKKHTAVSKQAAREMAKGAKRAAKADCALSVTGYAGPPSGAEGEEVGLVYIGCAVPGDVKGKKYHFTGSRKEVRAQASGAALSLLLSRLP